MTRHFKWTLALRAVFRLRPSPPGGASIRYVVDATEDGGAAILRQELSGASDGGLGRVEVLTLVAVLPYPIPSVAQRLDRGADTGVGVVSVHLLNRKM